MLDDILEHCHPHGALEQGATKAALQDVDSAYADSSKEVDGKADAEEFTNLLPLTGLFLTVLGDPNCAKFGKKARAHGQYSSGRPPVYENLLPFLTLAQVFFQLSFVFRISLSTLPARLFSLSLGMQMP